MKERRIKLIKKNFKLSNLTSFILVFAKSLDANCSGKKLEFEFINNTLQVSGAKQSFLAKELIKKLTKPDTFAICFV